MQRTQLRSSYTYLSMASVMYIIRSVQYFVPSLLMIVISMYSLELVEKNVTLSIVVHITDQCLLEIRTCKIFVKF